MENVFDDIVYIVEKDNGKREIYFRKEDIISYKDDKVYEAKICRRNIRMIDIDFEDGMNLVMF